MNDVRLPIETTREGDKITKVCVEDVYKMINKIYDAMNKSYNESEEILESVKKKYWTDSNVYYDGYLIVGTGVSQPCNDDVFDEETGMNIAFMKAKLNANIKKHNVLRRIYNSYINTIVVIGTELDKISEYINMDIDNIREYNPDYLKDEETEA